MSGSAARKAEHLLWLTCASCALPGIVALNGVSPTRVAALVALAFIPYAFLVVQADALSAVRAERLAMGGALCAGFVLVLSPPTLSDDLYRYLWDGRVLSHGLDPYAHPPSDPSLRTLRDGLWHQINHRDLRTIYPPLAQLLFAVADRISHTPFMLKLCMLSVHVVTIRVVGKLSALKDGNISARALMAYGLNPLVLSESALNGHIDVIVGSALGFALLGIAQKRTTLTTLAIVAATGTKLVGLLLLPLNARQGLKRALLTASLCLLALSPMLWPRPAESSGAMHYAQRWQGNDAFFSVIHSGVTHVLTLFASDDERARGHLRLTVLAPLIARARGTAFDPWAAADAARREVPDRADFEIPFLAGLVTRVLVLGIALAVAVTLARSTLGPLQAARFTLLAALLLAPQIHPWYLLWLLPIEAASGGLGGLAWSVSVLVAYAPLDLWQRARIWNEGSLAKLCEFGIVGLVFMVEGRLFNRERPE